MSDQWCNVHLVYFPLNSAKRTQVLDDESDYFNTDSHWLSKTDREALKNRDQQIREQRYASRLEARKMNLDFAGNPYEVEMASGRFPPRLLSSLWFSILFNFTSF